MKTKNIIIIAVFAVIIWFIYLARAILTPFIAAAIVAYLLHPVVDFLSAKTKAHRIIFIILIFLLLFAGIGWFGTFITQRVFHEAEALGRESQQLLEKAQSQIAYLPSWTQGFAAAAVVSIREAFVIEPAIIVPFFSGAFSRVFTFITFLFALFYFLKDGKKFIDYLLLFTRGERKLEAEIVLNKINAILGDYLRGQLLLVVLMATLGFAIFTFLGVRFSLILGLLIGFAEIVPMIGPILAGTTVALFSIFDDVSKFGLPPLYDGLLVLGAYIVFNQIENYVIVPQVMGRITKLHPLLVFFSVLAGGQLFGILGFILAVPVAVSLRILLDYLLDKLASR